MVDVIENVSYSDLSSQWAVIKHFTKLVFWDPKEISVQAIFQ